MRRLEAALKKERENFEALQVRLAAAQPRLSKVLIQPFAALFYLM